MNQKLNFTWRELSFADSKSTSAALDTFELKTRKVPDRLCAKNNRSLALADIMIDDYLKAFDLVEFKPLDSSFSRDRESNFASFGVFAKHHLPFGLKIPGVVGYLAALAKADVEENVNDFSMVWEKKASKLMLGSLSFVNSSCIPNSEYVPNLKRNFMEISVIAKKGINPDEEVTVFYGGDYFGDNRVECQCPFTEFHGPSVRLFDSWTRSGRKRTVPYRHLTETTTNVLSVPETTSQPTRKSATLNLKRRKLTTKFTKSRASKFCRRRRRTAVFSSSDSLTSSSETDNFEKSPVENNSMHLEICPLDSCSKVSDEPQSLSEERHDQIHVTSTPIHIQFCSNFEEFVPFETNFSSDSGSCTSKFSESSDELCKDSRISAASFSNRILELTSAHSLSDRALRDIIKLFKESLPHSNNVPSFHHIQSISNQSSDEIKKNWVSWWCCFLLQFWKTAGTCFNSKLWCTFKQS